MTCPVCFEPLDAPNHACPVEEGHAQAPIVIEHTAESASAITWGKLLGQKVHVTCAPPDDLLKTWAMFGTREQGKDELCEICLEPLDTLP